MQVYYASEEFGLDSVVTAEGHFLMADVFMKQGKSDITNSIYSEVHQHHLHLLSLIFSIHISYFSVFIRAMQVASTWHAHLSNLMECYSQKENKEEQYFGELIIFLL